MNSIHDQAKSIFLSAAEIATPEERHKFVDKECGDNHELRREVDELLRHQQALGGFLESPATLGIDAKATMPAPGETIRYFGDYELLEEIARGGMGVVFKARQVTLNRVIALKMILAGQLASDDDVRRFRTEAEAAANLDHPGIVPIYEIGQHGGQHYFSMKLIEGGSLSESLSKFAQNPRAAAELVCKLAEAVHHAHQRGILHRDLKPANVLIDEAGKPHITDFGLARQVEGDSELTRTGAIVGTPSYMPPEQARGEKSLTTATDVYSLGAILYELLTGQAPFKGSNPVETVLQVLGEEPKSVRLLNSKIDRDLELICLKCLKKEPDDRYSSAAALKSDLEHWLAGEPLSIRAPAMTSLMRLWLRQNFGAAGWTLVIGLVFGLGVGMLLWTATLQREVVQVVSTYTHLESEQLPWLLKFDWQPPTWLANAFILVGIFLGSYLGYFTALLVRPKNRDADIAAGLVVSLVGGLALFIAFLGPIGLYANFNNDDIRLFQVVAGANANVASGEFTFAYPDMKAVPDRERAALLYNKICADQLVNDRKALWVSLLASVVMSLFIGVGETMAAGPLLRRGTWYGVLLRYTELGIAISALTFVLCANLLFPMLFTMASYAVWKVLLMTAAAGIAIWLAANRRHWVIRVIALVVWMACFLSIVVHDFERYGHAGDLERRVARARHHISVKPDAVGYKTELGYWLTALADFWHRNKDWNYAIGPYEEALDTYRPLVKQGGMEFPRGEVLRRMKDWYPRLLETYDHLGRPKDRDYLMEVGFWHKNLGDFGYSKEDWSYVNDQYEQALATYQQILKENKGDKEKADEVFRIKEWYLRLVQSRDHLGRHKEAEKLMTDFDPQNIDQWREIAFFILRPHCDSMLKDKSATPAQCAEYVKNFVRGKQKNADAPEAAALVDHVVKALTQQNHWQVIGPFPGGKDFKGLATSYEPEQEKAPKPTYKVGDKTIAWKPVDVRPGDGVDLLKEISQWEYVVAYASTTFESPKEQKAVLRVGSDDGCKIWLNGELVHEIRVVRSCYEGSDQVKVKLKKGANQLLFKIETAWGGWGYSLDVIDESGWPMQLERHAQSK